MSYLLDVIFCGHLHFVSLAYISIDQPTLIELSWADISFHLFLAAGSCWAHLVFWWGVKIMPGTKGSTLQGTTPTSWLMCHFPVAHTTLTWSRWQTMGSWYSGNTPEQVVFSGTRLAAWVCFSAEPSYMGCTSQSTPTASLKHKYNARVASSHIKTCTKSHRLTRILL